MRRFPAFCRIIGISLIIGCVAVTAPAKIYKYQLEDGSWAFTDDPAELPEAKQALEGMEDYGSGLPDLYKKLADHIQPETDIELATLGTVAIQSGTGHGSGFFISHSGHILTNKHVIRTTDQQDAERESYYGAVESKIDDIEAEFNKEQKRIDAGCRRLESLESALHPSEYKDRRKYYDDWQKDLNRRQDDFEKKRGKFRREKHFKELDVSLRNLSRNFTIILADNSEYYAYLVAVSENRDLALLKLDGYRTPCLKLSRGFASSTGSQVFAIGNPIKLHNSVTAGVLSGYEGDFLKTDAKIYPGNSGGPLVNESGEVLGINTFKRLTRNYEGLGFAIPIQHALEEFESHLPSR